MHWCIHTPIWLNTYKPKWLNTYKPKWLHTYKPIWLHTYKPIWLYTYIPSSATITLLHYFTYTIGLSSLDKFMHASLPPFRGFISLSFFDPHTLSLSPFSISLTLWLQPRICCNLSLFLSRYLSHKNWSVPFHVPKVNERRKKSIFCEIKSDDDEGILKRKNCQNHFRFRYCIDNVGIGLIRSDIIK